MTEANGRSDAILREIGYLDVDYIEDTDEEQIEKVSEVLGNYLFTYFTRAMKQEITSRNQRPISMSERLDGFEGVINRKPVDI